MHSVSKSWVLIRFALIVSLVLPLAGRPSASAARVAPPPEPSETQRTSVATLRAPAPEPPPSLSDHTIYLKSGHFLPAASDRLARPRPATSERERVHILIQLDFIPRQAAKAVFETLDVKLLEYVPDYAWIASAPAADPAAVLALPGAVWAGTLAVEDKLDPAIIADQWFPHNLAPDGTAAVYVIMHKDESLDSGRELVEVHGGIVAGEVIGINLLIAELPRDNIHALAAKDAVQWIEQAAPPLGPTNDGIRAQIGVDIVQDAPYSLTGDWVDILIYDSGNVSSTHPDFSGRLTIGDSPFVMDHATHVAGIAAGSGSLSASAGGAALQWRGMAPGADVISYRYQPNFTGMIFYHDPGDIEQDWAGAQNSNGADIGNASLGSNIYANYPLSCTLMGNYGVTSVLMDQIVRGGNSVVGLGDRYIATWSAGNERSWAGSCGAYSTTAPPAAAKNPIHVGASRTDIDGGLTPYTSYGSKTMAPGTATAPAMTIATPTTAWGEPLWQRRPWPAASR